MNALPILMIGVPAAIARYAQYRAERERPVEEAPFERVDCWSGIDRARELFPSLAEMETR